MLPFMYLAGIGAAYQHPGEASDAEIDARNPHRDDERCLRRRSCPVRCRSLCVAWVIPLMLERFR